MIRSTLLALFLSISASVFSQTLKFRVVDRTLQVPLPGVNISIVDSLGHRLDLISSDSGMAQLFIPDSMSHGGNFYIVGSKTKYLSTDTVFAYKGKDTTLIELGLRSSLGPGCEFPPDPIYDLGQIQPRASIEPQLDRLIITCNRNPGLVFLMNFGYSSEEKNGHNLSEKRAKYITNYLTSNGLTSNEFIVKISEASRSGLAFEVESVNNK